MHPQCVTHGHALTRSTACCAGETFVNDPRKTNVCCAAETFVNGPRKTNVCCAAETFVNGPRKTNVCCAAACFSLGLIISYTFFSEKSMHFIFLYFLCIFIETQPEDPEALFLPQYRGWSFLCPCLLRFQVLSALYQ